MFKTSPTSIITLYVFAMDPTAALSVLSALVHILNIGEYKCSKFIFVIVCGITPGQMSRAIKIIVMIGAQISGASSNHSDKFESQGAPKGGHYSFGIGLKLNVEFYQSNVSALCHRPSPSAKPSTKSPGQLEASKLKCYVCYKCLSANRQE